MTVTGTSATPSSAAASPFQVGPKVRIAPAASAPLASSMTG